MAFQTLPYVPSPSCLSTRYLGCATVCGGVCGVRVQRCHNLGVHSTYSSSGGPDSCCDLLVVVGCCWCGRGPAYRLTELLVTDAAGARSCGVQHTREEEGAAARCCSRARQTSACHHQHPSASYEPARGINAHLFILAPPLVPSVCCLRACPACPLLAKKKQQPSTIPYVSCQFGCGGSRGVYSWKQVGESPDRCWRDLMCMRGARRYVLSV